MKKILLFIIFCIICNLQICAQEKSNKGSLIKWNYTSIGITAGYSNMFNSFKKEYYGHTAPTDLMHFDINILGIYIGMQFASKKPVMMFMVTMRK